MVSYKLLSSTNACDQKGITITLMEKYCMLKIKNQEKLNKLKMRRQFTHIQLNNRKGYMFSHITTAFFVV